MSHALQIALFSCALLGLRHGFDYDHLAAISDITSVQKGWRGAMQLGLLYALGHALTVAMLGIAVIFLHLPLPAHLDAIGERLVGATLILLTVYVLVTLFRRRSIDGHPHIPMSRVALLFTGARHLSWRVRKLVDPSLPKPDSFSFKYDRSSVFTVGIIHGLGAETPSQLLLFLLAANLGGARHGLVGLGCFLGGLLAMNTFMTATASGVFLSSQTNPRIQTFATWLTASYSLLIGVIFLCGASDKLPPLGH